MGNSRIAASLVAAAILVATVIGPGAGLVYRLMASFIARLIGGTVPEFYGLLTVIWNIIFFAPWLVKSLSGELPGTVEYLLLTTASAALLFLLVFHVYAAYRAPYYYSPRMFLFSIFLSGLWIPYLWS